MCIRVAVGGPGLSEVKLGELGKVEVCALSVEKVAVLLESGCVIVVHVYYKL